MTDHISLVGTVATEPKRVETRSGLLVSMRVVSQTRRIDRTTNDWVNGHANWVTVNAYRSLAEHVAESVHKGERIIVRGRLRIDDWQSQNGEQRGTTVIIDADSIGHDLQFGTSRFTKTVQAKGAGEAQSAANEHPSLGSQTSGQPSWIDRSPVDDDDAFAGGAPAATDDHEVSEREPARLSA